MSDTFIGFDFGLRRIGVAAGQSVTSSAAPVATIGARRGEPDWDGIDAIIDEWRPVALVVGIPLHLDGTKQPLTRAAHRFAAGLRSRYGLPVHEADERLTSRAAQDLVADARSRGARRTTRRGDVDRIAASLILEHWLADHVD